ncbi:MAG: polyphosphate polymerase domain-containing protein [Bacilli bacterium]|nr:polyphosphate polymerase domain-containing protein [Bacilli bacterium]
MSENIFQRVEQKYVLTKDQKENLLKEIDEHIEKDKYFESTICNIYFDTKNNDLIINSLEKPTFKEKLRLRSYGTPNIYSDVFLEIKEKYKGIVGKRRIKLKLKDFYSYLKKKNYDETNQIMKEINYYFEFHKLKPSIFIGYDRQSYKGIEDAELRITFDNNLRSRKDNLRLEYGDFGELFFDDDTYIMEIKTLGAMLLWLVRALSELKIYPTSFSKYGSIYKKERMKQLC